jgi:hypothetical protein
MTHPCATSVDGGQGLIKYREDIVDGLHNAPEAFLGLFSGRNLGELIVGVDPDSR